MKAASFHPQISRKFEIYTKVLLSCVQLYIARNQQSFVIFLQPLTHSYSWRVHLSTHEAPCTVLLSKHRPGSTRVVCLSTPPSDAGSVTKIRRLRQKKPHNAVAMGTKFCILCQNSTISTNGFLTKNLTLFQFS